MSSAMVVSLSSNQTPIQRFYDDKVLLITGATGFIGKILLQKCLKDLCVRKVYVIVRFKRGKDARKRLEELLQSPIFDTLKASDPTFATKINLMKGDLELPNLGLTESDMDILMKEVNCVFHCAATVNFDEPLPLAVKINVRSTRDILNLCKKMSNLQSFVHVSTAYSNPNRQIVEETVYEPKILPEKLLLLVDNFDKDIVDDIVKKRLLTGGFTNTYVLTKNASEYMIQKEGLDLPISILRPSIVVATEKQPMPGFVDSVIAITGLCLAIGLGFVRTIIWKPDNVLDVIPLDHVVNEIITVGWYNHTESNEQKQEVPVFNSVSSSIKPITIGEISDYFFKHSFTIGTRNRLWYPFIIVTQNETLYKIYALFLHTIPYYFADFCAYCLGKKPILVKFYEKYERLSQVSRFFMTNEWYFKSNNTRRLFQSLSPEDKELFYFDMKQVDYNELVLNNIKGMKKYILKDNTPDDDISMLYKQKFLHYFICFVLLASFTYFLLRLTYL
ncbi:fatty acyl-CoA reductase wat isoform X3 [Aethina tumida]|uniref:fatty acyl-CoA reductase wat isoform X3 n=1 Tax=Aethina tumida TaxID=116153 RepID=UPI002147F9C9|nr:fatty acyl-CoA reductase wat isoform X3 [Aethina tumida]